MELEKQMKHIEQLQKGFLFIASDMLGCISRFKNETIARLMDAGKKFIAVVDDPAEAAAEEKDRRSRRAPTENMAIPVSVYLVE